MAAHIHLIIGPVAAGKSTVARRLCAERRALFLDLDDWMVTLFRPDRPPVGLVEWYVERAERCVEQIWRVAQKALAVDVDVVLEIGLLQRHEREAFYWHADAHPASLTVHVVDAPRAVRRERVERRNRERGATWSMDVPPEVFELASDRWQPPGEAECRGRDVRWVQSG